jgi:hypothetical protein
VYLPYLSINVYLPRLFRGPGSPVCPLPSTGQRGRWTRCRPPAGSAPIAGVYIVRGLYCYVGLYCRYFVMLVYIVRVILSLHCYVGLYCLGYIVRVVFFEGYIVIWVGLYWNIRVVSYYQQVSTVISVYGGLLCYYGIHLVGYIDISIIGFYGIDV